jgi:hypothetical protein
MVCQECLPILPFVGKDSEGELWIEGLPASKQVTLILVFSIVNPSLKEFYAESGWIPMEKAVTLVGSKDNPKISNELMMRFLSEKGKRGRPAFESIPLYFGEDTW